MYVHSTLDPLHYKLQDFKLVQHSQMLQTQYLIMMVLEHGWIVQLAKLWPLKHEDLPSIPSTHVKMPGKQLTLAIPELVRWKRADTGSLLAHWAIN